MVALGMELARYEPDIINFSESLRFLTFGDRLRCPEPIARITCKPLLSSSILSVALEAR